MQVRIKLALVLLSTLLLASAKASLAQCSTTDDVFGCATPDAPILPIPTGATSVSVDGRRQIGVPAADRSSESSAVGSLGVTNSDSDLSLKAARLQHRDDRLQPSEFQKFVFASTGQNLRVFGQELFLSDFTTFSPPVNAPASPETVLGPDDELRIRVWGQVNFSDNLRVSREGTIYLPKIGSVHVAGLPFSALAQHIRQAMDPIYHGYELSVDLGEIHSIQIYITGRARHPGAFTVNALNSLVDAVFTSGGPSESGSMRHIQVKRAGKVVTDYDLYALLVKGDKTGDIQLQPGDVLYYPSVGPQVAILGSVRQAGIYELRGQQSLADLLDAAGGRSTVAANSQILVDRIADHLLRRSFQVSADNNGMATELVDGDIVRINPVVSSFSETVTLRGALANPGRFGWHAGMRLSDVLPDRDSLLKRNYWLERTKLGFPVPERVANSIDQTELSEQSEDKPPVVKSPADQTNWNYAVVERLNPATMATSLVPFNLGKLVLEHDASQNLELSAGDVITIFTQSDIKIPLKEQTKYIRLEGELVHPGIYSIAPGDTLRTIVKRAGGLTPQAYLYGSRFTRESTKILEQQEIREFADSMEKQLQRDAVSTDAAGNRLTDDRTFEQNKQLVAKVRSIYATGRIVLNLGDASVDEIPEMHLEDGDRFEVPFAPDTVQVIGAVYNPQAFLYRRGMKSREALQLAGGTKREADRKRSFVLRADGSVATHDADPRMFAHGFADIKLNPGDSIIVPEKSMRPTALSKTLSWAQTLSPGAINALELNAIK
jgi:polysaccharide biosynthesis/export protein